MIGQILNTIPGVGLAANAAISVSTAMTAEAVIDHANKTGNLGDAEHPKWKGVKKVTLKPDLGEPFTARILNLPPNISAGKRLITGFKPGANDNRLYTSVGGTAYLSDDEPIKKISDTYISLCYGTGNYGYHQASYVEDKIVEGVIPEQIKAYMDAHPKTK